MGCHLAVLKSAMRRSFFIQIVHLLPVLVLQLPLGSEDFDFVLQVCFFGRVLTEWVVFGLVAACAYTTGSSMSRFVLKLSD